MSGATRIHYLHPILGWPACGWNREVRVASELDRVTCARCRRSVGFKQAAAERWRKTLQAPAIDTTIIRRGTP